MDRDINEYDEWIDNILKGWLMFREYIVKDGDCCFWVVVRNVYKLIEIRGRNIYVYEYLVYFGFVNLSEESLSNRLRVLIVLEWFGENR